MPTHIQKRRLFVILLVTAIILPLINTFVLGAALTITSSDIVYPEIVPQLIGYASEILSVACLFASGAAAAVALSYPRCGAACYIIYLVSPPLIYLAMITLDRIFYGSSVLTDQYISYCVTSCLYELLRSVILLAIVRLIRCRADKKRRDYPLELFSAKGRLSRAIVFSSLVLFLSLVLSSLTETISLLVDVGAPINTTELIYLVLPYPTALVYSLLGYLLMYLVARLIVGTQAESTPETAQTAANNTL